MIFDSHAHYDDSQFDEDREVVLKTIKEKGVIGVLNCGSDLKSLKATVEMVEQYEFIYGALGIHPEYANFIDEDLLERLKELCKNPKIVAIGEIGLDYYWEENPSRDIQKEAFRKQMQLARELNLPVVIHDREAHQDTLEIMKEFGDVKGVVHCFSGSVEFARECLKLGYYIGITGVVTFKNAKVIKEVVKAVPIDKLLVETDCPYMAPTPFRGKRNQSDFITYIMEEIAALKNITRQEVESEMVKNTKNLLNLN
ncbi:TatD family hydrolase [Clostridium sp.]|uniref:TatD family hydrolase n=1 Tax=Clostridium sp. TaxID=1506 RepID=UPI002FCBCA97